MKVIGDIQISDQTILTISSSTKIEFQDFYSIECKGSIQAIGEADGRIRFTSAHPELFVPDSSFSGAWNGIRFHNTSYDNEKSTFSYCDFACSKACGNSVKGGVFSLYHYSKVRIENCSFTQNCADFGSVIGVDYQSSPEIIDCIFNKNYAFVGGSPIYSAYSYPRVINNTIINNYVLNDDINYRTGAVQSFISKPRIINNIIWDNASQYIVSGQITECKDFYTSYNNIEYGHGGMGNIDEDPLCNYSATYAYSLMQSSPCIDAGTPDTSNLFLPFFDHAGNERIYNSRIDMGALEWQGYGIDEEPEAHEMYLTSCPNPFSNSTIISFNSTSNFHKLTQIRIYNIKGQLVRELKIQNLKLKMNEVVWDGKDERGKKISAGVYFVKIECGRELGVRKVVLIK